MGPACGQCAPVGPRAVSGHGGFWTHCESCLCGCFTVITRVSSLLLPPSDSFLFFFVSIFFFIILSPALFCKFLLFSSLSRCPFSCSSFFVEQILKSLRCLFPFLFPRFPDCVWTWFDSVLQGMECSSGEKEDTGVSGELRGCCWLRFVGRLWLLVLCNV